MKKNKKNLIYSILLLILLSIGIGYAYLTSNLSITGSTEIAANSWDIHFANLVVNENSVDATTPAAIDTNDDTSITYTVKLNRPKQFYEFTVDVVNEGTLPGKVSISSLSGITSEAENIVDYSINYTNGNPVQIGDILNGGATKSVMVRVYYKDNIEIEDLPTSNLNLTLTYNLQYVQSEVDELPTTNDLIEQLKIENSSCFIKYTDSVTDEVGNTVSEATNVYFNRCVNKRNIIFNNMCWQMIRTTETGGIKMIYNGDVVDGKCLSSRKGHKGIVQQNNTDQTLSSSYLYGSSFTYDTENNTFTLIDATTAMWSDSTYENLIGKFTCKTTSDTCSTLYQINGYKSNTQGYSTAYTIGYTNYAQIGISSFNANEKSPAMVGYMFNKVYNPNNRMPGTTEYKYSSGFTYDTSTNTYTLSGITQNISAWSSGYNTIDNTHYTCWNTSGTCTTISYIHDTSSLSAYYFNMSGGRSVSDLLEEMLSYNDVNRYNSSIKGIIDAWYRQNMISKTNMLEDTVYCNARNIKDYGKFNPDGGSTITNLNFKNYNFLEINLACPNETDQFAVGNNKAKLTYPVSLATEEELNKLTNNNSSTYYPYLTNTGYKWWEISPISFGTSVAYVNSASSYGVVGDSANVKDSLGVRFVVSLKNRAVVSEGDGSEESPWVVE